MKITTRQILSELIWVAIAFGITILFISILFNWSITEDTIDIHLHDTMLVIHCWHFLLPLCLLTTFIIYFFKEYRKSFSRVLPNLLLVVVGVIYVILSTVIIINATLMAIGGITLYPPLSTLKQDGPIITQNAATTFITTILTVIQIVVLVMLLYATFRWGKSGLKRSYWRHLGQPS